MSIRAGTPFNVDVIGSGLVGIVVLSIIGILVTVTTFVCLYIQFGYKNKRSPLYTLGNFIFMLMGYIVLCSSIALGVIVYGGGDSMGYKSIPLTEKSLEDITKTVEIDDNIKVVNTSINKDIEDKVDFVLYIADSLPSENLYYTQESMYIGQSTVFGDVFDQENYQILLTNDKNYLDNDLKTFVGTENEIFITERVNSILDNKVADYFSLVKTLNYFAYAVFLMFGVFLFVYRNRKDKSDSYRNKNDLVNPI